MMAMVMERTSLPTGNDALVDALDDILDSSIQLRNYHSIRWWLVHYYLQGYRQIDITSWSEGLVNVSFEDAQGEMQLQYEKLVDQYRVEIGRLLRINTDPVAERDGFGLDSVRKSGTAHTLLTYMDSRSSIYTRHRTLARLAEVLVKFGTAGLHHYREAGEEDIGLRTRKEIVPPWELLSMSGDTFSHDEERGIMRHRMVPLEWAKSQPHLEKAFGEASVEDLGVIEMNYGASPTSGGPGGRGEYGSGLSYRGGSSQSRRDERDASNWSESRGKRGGKSDETVQQWIEFTEAWEMYDGQYVSRYVCKAHDVIGHDTVYDEKIVCPLSICRYVDIGSFYGRGFVDINLSMNYEVEKLLANLFQNVRDFDVFGTTVVNATSGISKEDVQAPERRKVLFADPDPNSKTEPVYKIEPTNSGDAPLKVLATAIDVQQSIAGHSPMLGGESVGRVDSAAALGFIFESGNINIIGTSNSIADAYIGCYASMLQAAKFELAGDRASIPLPAIDSRMLGVKIDLKSGTVELEQELVPDPWDVRLDIKERAASSPEQVKQEAGLMLEAQLMSPTEFRILNEKENLGFKFVYRTEFEQWRRAVLMKLVVFNDGETPGVIPGGIDYEDAEIVLAVLAELMGGPEFLVASDAVRGTFMDIRDEYMRSLGSLADALPSMTQIEGVLPQEPQQQQGQMQGGAPLQLRA